MADTVEAREVLVQPWQPALAAHHHHLARDAIAPHRVAR